MGRSNSLKPASWNAPAKHARANVLTSDDYGMSACGPHGVNYLTGGNISW